MAKKEGEMKLKSPAEKKARVFAVVNTIFLMWAFLYILYQVFNPLIVQEGSYRQQVGSCSRRPPDNGKCFSAAFVTTLLLSLVAWLISASAQ